MQTKVAVPVHPTRVLFASYHCYHDPTSGAAVCTRDLFAALATRGWRCGAVTGPFLDDPAAVPIGETLRARPGVQTAHGTAGSSSFHVHTVAETAGFPVTVFEPLPAAAARQPSAVETGAFLVLVADVIRRFRPNVVLLYGGDTASRGVIPLARQAGARVVFWLHNFAYPDASSFTGCDAVVVPSDFSREHYRHAIGLNCIALPPVVDLSRVVVDRPGGGKYLTYVNPIPEKGVFLFARIVAALGERRPDIPVLVVEGRGRADWLRRCGLNSANTTSVFRMPNTSDPRNFYHVSRLLIMPSVWQESFGRVAVEGMMNGIPVVASDRGALPKVIGQGGVCLPIPLHVSSETRTPLTEEELARWIGTILDLWDNPASLHAATLAARAAAERWHPDRVIPLWEQFLSSRDQ